MASLWRKNRVSRPGQLRRLRPAVIFTSLMIFSLASFCWGEDFYRSLDGTVGKARVQMTLTSASGVLSGSYYYEKYGKPIPLKGKLAGNKVVLEEKGGSMEGQFGKDGSFQGAWTSKDKKKSAPVTLSEARDSVSFTVYSVNKDLPVKGKSVSKCSVKRVYLHPASYGDNRNVDTLRAAVFKSYFGKEGAAAKGDPRKAIDLEVKNFGSDCKESQDDEGYAERGGIEMATERTMSVVFNGNNILSLKTESWEYTGGAHGNPSTAYMVIDLEKAAALTLKGIFKPGYDTYLGTIVTKKLKEQAAENAGTTNLKEAGYEDFKENRLNDPQFYIIPDGIGFFYNVYAIAPYAMGQTEIFVPFTEIKKDRLNPGTTVYKLAYGKK